jgi:hypothetical protein
MKLLRTNWQHSIADGAPITPLGSQTLATAISVKVECIACGHVELLCDHAQKKLLTLRLLGG